MLTSRDREGLTRLGFDPDVDAETFAPQRLFVLRACLDFRYGSASPEGQTNEALANAVEAIFIQKTAF